VFSRRTACSRQINALTEALGRRRAAGARLLDLANSNPTASELPYAADEIRAAFAGAALLDYDPDARGVRAARAAIAAHCQGAGLRLDPERLLLTASTSEAYATLFKLLCDPGDQVLVPAPSYPLLEHLAAFEGVSLSRYRLAYDGSWYVDFDSLRRALTERTRAVVVVHPNNPTGSYVKQEELSRLIELGLPLISDEVFRPYRLRAPADAAGSLLQSGAELVFCLDGLSKRVGLPQLKLSWMAVGGRPDLVAESLERLELVADCWLSVSTPVQQAAGEMLRAGLQTQAAVLARLERNLSTLERELAGAACDPLRVEGGWNAIVRLPAVMSEEQWCRTLLEQDDVWVQPGYFYDFASEAYVVASLLTPPERWEEGVRRLRRRVDRVAG